MNNYILESAAKREYLFSIRLWMLLGHREFSETAPCRAELLLCRLCRKNTNRLAQPLLNCTTEVLNAYPCISPRQNFNYRDSVTERLVSGRFGDVFKLPSNSPQRIFTKGGGGWALGSHLWISLGVGNRLFWHPSYFEGGDFSYGHFVNV